MVAADLNSNADYKRVAKAVAPVVTALDWRNPLAQAIWAISQAGSAPAAFELGRIFYGTLITIAAAEAIPAAEIGTGSMDTALESCEAVASSFSPHFPRVAIPARDLTG